MSKIKNEDIVDAKTRHAEARLKQVEELKRVKELFSITFGSPEGKKVLAYIRKLCSYNESPKVVIDGEYQVQSTVHNVARQEVYLQIRSLIKPRILIDVEFNKEYQDV